MDAFAVFSIPDMYRKQPGAAQIGLIVREDERPEVADIGRLTAWRHKHGRNFKPEILREYLLVFGEVFRLVAYS